MISELQVVTSTSDEQIQEKSMCCCISIMSSNLKYVNYFKWMIFKKIWLKPTKDKIIGTLAC